MANDLNAIDQLKQDDLAPNAECKVDPHENKLSKGMTVYKRETGMAFEVINVSHANGIRHYNLLCAETGACYYLSKFALEQDYARDQARVEKFGLRMVKRLSEMWAK